MAHRDNRIREEWEKYQGSPARSQSISLSPAISLSPKRIQPKCTCTPQAQNAFPSQWNIVFSPENVASSSFASSTPERASNINPDASLRAWIQNLEYSPILVREKPEWVSKNIKCLRSNASPAFQSPKFVMDFFMCVSVKKKKEEEEKKWAKGNGFGKGCLWCVSNSECVIWEGFLRRMSRG